MIVTLTWIACVICSSMILTLCEFAWLALVVIDAFGHIIVLCRYAYSCHSKDSVQCIYIHIQEECGSGTVMVVIAHFFQFCSIILQYIFYVFCAVYVCNGSGNTFT